MKWRSGQQTFGTYALKHRSKIGNLFKSELIDGFLTDIRHVGDARSTLDDDRL